MGADEAAVAALDAEVGVPHGDHVRDVALLVGGRAARIGAVDRQRADRQRVAPAGDHLGGDRADELRRVGRDDRRQPAGRRHLLGHLDPVQCRPVPGRPRPGCARRPRRRAVPYVLAIDALIRSIACSRAGRRRWRRSTSAARCWSARPGRRHGRSGRRRSRRRRDAWRGSAPGPAADSASQTSAGRVRQLSSSVAPGAPGRARRPGRAGRTGGSRRSSPAGSDSGALIGVGPNRRCETVCEPDFLES